MLKFKSLSNKISFKLGCVIYLVVILASACNKEEFLSKKPSSEIIIPTRLDELRALMDNEENVWSTPLLGLQSSDEYYWSYSSWNAEQARQRNAYIWAPNVYEGQSFSFEDDWNKLWKQIFIANVVLEALPKITPLANEQSEWRSLKGTAHFLRAKALFALAEVFCMPYDEQSSETDLGLPIRLSPQVDAQIQRSSIKSTYGQINTDLHIAKEFLDGMTITDNRIRPSKLAAYGMLARIYLSQRRYDLAGQFADSVLSRYNVLMDYNKITAFSTLNPETFYQNIMRAGVFSFTASSGILNVDSVLFKMYEQNDLRKTLYYRTNASGRIYLKFPYSGLNYLFSGLATDEMYLIRAENYARKGILDKAATDINTLLVNRYKKDTFNPISFIGTNDAVSFIINERRKELAFRGARWSDVRRLNKEGANITMKRILNGKEYLLPPNDPRFALYIPIYEIELSGIKQNPR